MHPVQNEPVLTGLTAALASAGALLAAFGVHLTDLQIAAIVQFVQAAYLLAFLVRAQVTPKARLPRVVGMDASGQPIVRDPAA
jgi:predicted anti-sigma-YlaC factor YlaD